MQGNHRWKLFSMMVLQFFIWGAWLPVLFDIMGGLQFGDSEKAWIGSAFAVASIVGIFFSNQFADRAFAAERFLAFSHLVGGLALGGLYYADSFSLFFPLMLVHSLLYVPTISVTNSLAFANMADPQKEFGIVRMGGTVGWILAQWPLYFILKEFPPEQALQAKRAVFLVGGIASLLLAAFSMTLPHTPPKPAAASGGGLALFRAASLLKVPFVLALFVVTLIDATVHNGYFVLTFTFLDKVGFEPGLIMPVMSIGQVAEVGTMAVLGLALKKLGWKTTLTLGVLGHVARFGVFALTKDHTAIMVVQILHGICYAFFFATVYIFIDEFFPKDVRSSAQGLFNLLILGLGDLAAKWIFVPLQAKHTGADGVIDYGTLFLWPTGMAAGAALLLLVAFHPPKIASK
jgi:nucleoside transporter